jgi:hypothetical protein
MQNYNLMQSEKLKRSLTIRDIWTRAMSSNNRMKTLPEFKIFLLIYTKVLLHIIFRQYMPNKRPVLPAAPKE